MKKILYISVLTVVFLSCKTQSNIINEEIKIYENGNYDTPIPEYKTPKPSPKDGTCTSLDKTETVSQTSYIDYYPTSADYVEPIKTAIQYLGVRYRGGGTTRAGMDCSGLVYTSFKAHEITLPRSSTDMAKIGVSVTKKHAKPGDLIFFRTNGRHRINHVGIVTEVLDNEIKFIHSSIQRGVIISSTKEPYYTRTYAQINRVLEQ